jgi:hypothetical protein
MSARSSCCLQSGACNINSFVPTGHFQLGLCFTCGLSPLSVIYFDNVGLSNLTFDLSFAYNIKIFASRGEENNIHNQLYNIIAGCFVIRPEGST